MTRRGPSWWCALGVVALVGCHRAPSPSPDAAPGQAGRTLGFEANQGQFDPEVRFVARGNGFALWLTDRGASLVLHDATRPAEDLTLGMTAPGMKAVTPDGLLPGRVSYLRGRDPSRWITDAPRYARVTYRDVRPGVDLVFRGEDGRLEYDLVLAPGASVGGAEIAFSGARGLSVDAAGALVVGTARDDLRQPAPVAYEEGDDGARTPVAASYRVEDDRRVAFAVAPHDAHRRLVIDPVLLYSSYLGGSSYDAASAVALDRAGNVYVAGFTTSLDFPTAHAAQGVSAGSTDVFVAKLDPTGKELLYATYLGGSGEDEAYALAIDADGDACVTGTTSSLDYPTAGAPAQANNNGSYNAFVSKLGPTGASLVFSGYFGGSVFDVAQGIALDRTGNVYVAGSTQSPDLPTNSAFQQTLQGLQNVFVAELSSDGTKVLGATYLGGSGDDGAQAIAVDAAGDAYVAGYSRSVDFPVAHALQSDLLGTQNAFVAELTPDLLDVTFATYLGGSGSDAANALAVDEAGDIYLAGATSSPDFPVKGAAQIANRGGDDAFVAKLAAGGASIEYATFLGGSDTDAAFGIAIDAAGDAFVVGATRSTDFPVKGAFQGTNRAAAAPDGTAFVAQIGPTGAALLGSSYLGGAGGASAMGVAVGKGDVAWMVGGAGAGLPAVGALFASYASLAANGQNAFLAKMSPEAGVEIVFDAGAGVAEAGLEAAPSDEGGGVEVVDVTPSPPKPSPAASGCGCRTASAPGVESRASLGVLLATALAWRRRRPAPTKAGRR